QRWLEVVRARRPFVGLKLATTLDGRIATRTGESKWITGPESRDEGHRLRAAYDAVLAGAGTVAADDPELTARPGGAYATRQPLRVVVDGGLSISPGARLLSTSTPGPALILTTEAGMASRGHEFRSEMVLPLAREGRITAIAILEHLAGRGVSSVLVEGGGDLAWTFVEAGLVDRVYAFIGPLLVGGVEARAAVAGMGFARLAEALPLRFVGCRQLGDDVILDAVAA
ncbi:MAG: bifunctional diaminohydroxyphosphoribosylaminopyrimidine deaminase/5-amino-6-(5-phosphoribosylamino)uracil reductase RibD, partial [Candidatus Dormibacteria bacterium]